MVKLSRLGAMLAIAGATCAQLPTIHYAWARNGARAPKALGDVDADGVSDLIVSALPNNAPGYVELRSGATGALIRTINQPANGFGFGHETAALGDIDGDGAPDLAVAAPLAVIPGLPFPWPSGYLEPTGALYAFSGATGAQLWMIHPPGVTNLVLSPVAGFVFLSPLGDVNGDGHVDLVTGRTGGGEICGQYFFTGSPALTTGQIDVISGIDGAAIRAHAGSLGDRYPSDAAGIGDFDGDGTGDYAAIGIGRAGFTINCAPFPNPANVYPPYPSQVRVFSGATGAELFGVTGPLAQSGRVGPVGDFDADGFADVGVAVALTSPASTHLLVHRGPSGAPAHAYVYWTSPATSPYLSGVGDRNGDGYADYAMPSASGAPEFRSGFDASLLGVLSPAALGSRFNLLGDLTGDGVPELGTVGAITPNSSLPSSVVLATPFAGVAAAVASVGLGCAPGGAAPVLSAPPPLLGSVWTMSVSNAPSAATFLALAGVPAAAPLSLGGGCEVYLDLALPLFTGPMLIADANGSGATPPMPLPLVVTMAGASLRVQAVAFVAGGLALSNGLDVVFGF